MEILLTRHGQTEWNLLKKVQGKADIELNEKGIQQAEETRDFLKNEKIDLILCSPLKRALQTAFDFNAFWSYKQNLKYDKAENIKDFFGRVYDFLESIKNEYAGKRILIVAHGGISIPVKCYFEGIPNTETLLPLCLENCEVAKYSYKELDLER